MFIRRPQDIGAIVRSTRIDRGLNQQELADRLGVSRWWVNELEGGKATARMDLVLRALNELDIIIAAYTSNEAANHGLGVPESDVTPVIDIDAIADTGLQPRSPRRRGRAKRREQ